MLSNTSAATDTICCAAIVARHNFKVSMVQKNTAYFFVYKILLPIIYNKDMYEQ